MSRELTVSLPAGGTVTARVYEAAAPATDAALILAHGAGAGQDSPFMIAFATRARRASASTRSPSTSPTPNSGGRVPDRRPVLEACYRAVIEQVRREVPAARQALFIGGKSMGGRIATHVATDPQLGLAGVVLLGYPLHPPGRPEERRDAHLPTSRRRCCSSRAAATPSAPRRNSSR